MTQVEIESILQHEDIQGLLEDAETTGSVRQPELADADRGAPARRARDGRALQRARASRDRDRRGGAREGGEEGEGARASPAPDLVRDDDRRAPALPARGGPARAPDRGSGSRARQADRARRHGREDAHDPVEPAARRLDREELPQPGPALPRPDPGRNARVSSAPSRSSTGAAATSSRPTPRGGSARRLRARSPTRRARSGCRSTSSSVCRR